jgi:hypothetical protein
MKWQKRTRAKAVCLVSRALAKFRSVLPPKREKPLCFLTDEVPLEERAKPSMRIDRTKELEEADKSR